MIKRYSTSEMAAIWSDQAKYEEWLQVELAVLRARCDMGFVPVHVFRDIEERASFNIPRIEELEAEVKHDLLAFVMCVQESLPPELGKFFHADGLTSFDTEEPAQARSVIASIGHIRLALNSLMAEMMVKAVRYKDLLKIQRTHGQHAQPSTLGLEFLWWYDALKRQAKFIDAACEEMHYSKISGAVGTYGGGLTPELEERALAILELKPAPISMQIVLRDRIAHVVNAMAVLAGVLENIALNIRLMGQTEIRELQEPFGKKQKGSSVMPHKKNTILTENLTGIARMVRHYAGMALENIPTWSGRDITHSSVERVMLPDVFNLVHFALRRMTSVVRGLVVNESQHRRNLELLWGTVFSPDVKELLIANGCDPEQAYRIAQEAAFEAVEERKPYCGVLMDRGDVPEQIKKDGSLVDLFDYKRTVRFTDEVFARFKYDPEYGIAQDEIRGEEIRQESKSQ